MPNFYSRLRASRNDSDALAGCVNRVVRQLSEIETQHNKAGMLLGKIQSGKTMAFLGVIAKAFDSGFDIAIILTKGTKALSEQTVSRIRRDFTDFDKMDELKIFDIMKMPEELTSFEMRQKLIFVVKKQYRNLDRILNLFVKDQPTLSKKKVLLIDDEADLASIRFVKNKETEELDQGKIASQIDGLRRLVASVAFLQVTATPYALYLQPDEYTAVRGGFVFLPKKPAFTELLPIHAGYVGGNDYFGDFDDDDPRSYLYIEVPIEEHNALRSLDGRVARKDRPYSSERIEKLRLALMNFITGVVIRHWQCEQAGERPKKYALIIHNDTRKKAHDWQWETVGMLLDVFKNSAANEDSALRTLFTESFENLSKSIIADGGQMPDASLAFKNVCEALMGGDVMRERVNSDKNVIDLLDDNSELKLRTPFNIFIGGNILDRGITIPNLLGFYYGRNPKTMQADTVLQHSRMYGNRDRRDLAATRFYTSREVFDRLKKIHEFEVALRTAFETGAHDRGVIFIRSDDSRRVLPCAPNKIQMSEVYTIRPGGRMLPVGFQSLPKTKIEKTICSIDRLLPGHCLNSDTPAQIDSLLAHDILNLIEKTLETDPDQWDWNALHATIDYFTKVRPDRDPSGTIWLMGYTDRSITRLRQSGRPSDAPDTKQQRDIAEKYAKQSPMLLLLKQDGLKEKDWGGFPFWWPVLIAPTEAEPCVYAHEKQVS